MGESTSKKRGVLDWIEWMGNKLPEPVLLFALFAAVVVLVSGIGAAVDWSVQPVQPRVVMVEAVDAAGVPVLDGQGKAVLQPKMGAGGMPEIELREVGSPIEPRSLMTGEGVYWMLSNMLRNFTMTPALGLIFVAMLGIGLAEKFGLFSALMRALALAAPKRLLTPIIVFVGANAAIASDAGYIVLPPLAAALYHAVGRHPLAGMAAAFAGVAGGFGGGVFPNAADGFLAGVATSSAHVVDPQYGPVEATHNLYFKAASAVIVMFGGWFVTDRIVEPRLMRGMGEANDVLPAQSNMALTGDEKKGLRAAGLAFLVVMGLFAALTLIPGAPLAGTGAQSMPDGRMLTFQPVSPVNGEAALNASPEQVLFRDGSALGGPFAVLRGSGAPSLVERPAERWSQVIVPMILFAFLLPGMVFGRVTGVLQTQRDFVEGLYSGIRSIVPVLCIAFFLAQFVAYFQYTQLDRMLAYTGGALLVHADLPAPVLLTAFILLVVGGDFAMSGMLSKFGVMAPIFIPMFMFVGISPELTTAAYRIGDSVVNIITPLNSYLLIILAVMQKYRTSAGLGSLIALMLPYSVVLFLTWTSFLLIWMLTGVPLGTGGGLYYVPPH